MHRTVDSWRQLSSSQTLIENRERRKSLGEGASVASRKAQCMAAKLMLAADLSWSQLHWEQPWHCRDGAVRIGHVWLSHPSLFPAPSVAQGGICTWASQYVDLLAWTAHPHILTHPTSLCERSTVAGNSGLFSCRNSHQQCQAQSDHISWVCFIAVKEKSYSILKNHVML